jgi:hypothetical protein
MFRQLGAFLMKLVGLALLYCALTVLKRLSSRLIVFCREQWSVRA